MKEKGKTVLLLLGWTVILGGIYWAFTGTEYSVFVTAVYAIAALLFSVFFILVNGGVRSLPSVEEARYKKELEKQKDQKNPAPVSSPPPRPDLFRLGVEKQENAAKILLILAAPFFFVLVVDFIYLHYFFNG